MVGQVNEEFGFLRGDLLDGFKRCFEAQRLELLGGTELERLLRAQDIQTVILAGVTTAGAILSTVRQACDSAWKKAPY
jgi:nicotinamidase-related amidase